MLGVCYYPEHWPEERWAIDAGLMAEAGLELVRVGEFAWARYEPQPDQFAWDWLDRAIATLAAAGLRIVLGTPTATPPAWLSTAYPEVLRVGSDGRRWMHGGRRHTCPTSPTYREQSARIVTALAERYGQHPAVYAWQIDNELGNHSTARCACDCCRSAFGAWCRERYGSLEALNAAWGTIFWSGMLIDWDHIPLPSDPIGGSHNPALQLDYRRFCSDANIDGLRAQADILRRLSPGRLLTTNIAPLDEEINWHALAREVDVMSWDNYPHGFPGPADVASFHALVRGLKRRPFWVMEQQPGPINWTPYNPPVPPGQVRLWTYQAQLRGAENVLYFRWRACLFGQEQYHSGLLTHGARPARGYAEAQQTASELREHGDPAPAPAKVALLYSYEDAWAMQIDPHNRDFNYWEMLRGIYASLWCRGIAIDLLHRGSDLAGYETIIACAPMLIDEGEAQRWEQLVRDGARLVLTCRAFTKRQQNTWTDQLLPSGLQGLLGVEVVEWLSLPPDAPAEVHLRLGEVAAVPLWAEVLRADGAEVLTSYASDYYAGQPAITAHQLGDGQAVTVGPYPTAEVLGWLWDQLFKDVEELPPGIELVPTESGIALLSHGVAEEIALPGTWRDRASGHEAEDSVAIEPYEVLFLERL